MSCIRKNDHRKAVHERERKSVLSLSAKKQGIPRPYLPIISSDLSHYFVFDAADAERGIP